MHLISKLVSNSSNCLLNKFRNQIESYIRETRMVETAIVS